ncbi:MAG TPA: hypothetical protein PK646_04250 [Bacillota bacterium]|jgi:hypothetical protein|nr:hypothetical protein [Fastidiosipila sp.]HPX92798.1 hypothetical protein [Bacillota bacterium]HQB81283.1 hypothetical protein [Bacillota bacterium]
MKTKHSRNKKNRQVMPGMILAAVFISIGLSLLANGRAREIHSFSLPSVPLIIPSAFLPQEVDIPDPSLEKALLEACGKSPGYKLTDNDLWGLTGRLGVDRRNIKDLEGIQHCVNVTRLDASGNPVNHLPDIQSMKKLEDLDLQQCQLTQVPPIVSKLPNLRELILSENPIGNTLQGLDGCKNLERLYLRGCGISSFPADLDLPKLGYLGLSNNQLTSFPFLKGHKTLECIDVADNQISELPADLGVYPKLEGLHIDGNKVKRLPDKMGNLIKLDAFGNELTGLPDSIGKSKLEQLHVRGNNLTSLPLSLFASSNLKELDVSYNRLTSLPQGLDGVIGTSGLIELDVSYNQLTSLSEALFKAKHRPAFTRNSTGYAACLPVSRKSPGDTLISATTTWISHPAAAP